MKRMDCFRLSALPLAFAGLIAAATPGLAAAQQADITTIHLFLHKDAEIHPRDAQVRLLKPWVAEMEQHVVPGQRFEIMVHEDAPGVVDMMYGDAATLDRFAKAARAYVENRGLPAGGLTRYAMITQRTPLADGGRALGISWAGKPFAIGSLAASDDILGHELGHTFGAEHQEEPGPNYCRHYMTDESLIPIQAPCHTYSDANRERIMKYIAARQ